MVSDRYSRLRQLPWWDTETIEHACALVAGAGALGNEVVKNLLLFGWKTIIVVDFDHVDLSNLSRSILFRTEDVKKPKVKVIEKHAHEINPDCTVIGINGDLRLTVSAGLVSRSSVVFGCLDNIAARLALSNLAGQAERLLIDGGLSVWEGTVSNFFPSTGTCYACTLTQKDIHDLNLRRSCPAYAERARKARGVPTTATVSSITAAFMVQHGLRWLHGERAPEFPLNTQVRIDTRHDRLWAIEMPKNPECYLHSEPVRNVTKIKTNNNDSWNDILAYCKEILKNNNITIYLPHFVLLSWECPNCGVRQPDIYQIAVPDEPISCLECNELVIPTFANSISGNESWLHYSPTDMGFPAWSWINAVDMNGKTITVELDNELDRWVE